MSCMFICANWTTLLMLSTCSLREKTPFIAIFYCTCTFYLVFSFSDWCRICLHWEKTQLFKFKNQYWDWSNEDANNLIFLCSPRNNVYFHINAMCAPIWNEAGAQVGLVLCGSSCFRVSLWLLSFRDSCWCSLHKKALCQRDAGAGWAEDNSAGPCNVFLDCTRSCFCHAPDLFYCTFRRRFEVRC